MAYNDRNSDQEWEFSSESIEGEGNLTEDPKIISGKGKKTTVVLRVAANSAARNANGDMVKHVAYRDIKVFGRRAENALEKLSKGDPVVYKGSLKPKSYTNRDGEEIKDFEIIASYIGLGMLGKPKGGSSRDDERSSRRSSRSSRDERSHSSRSSRDEEPEDDESYEDPEDDASDLDEAPRSRGRSRSRSRSRRNEDDGIEDYSSPIMEDIN